ncbi:MAG: gliding motility-associated ABC transporter ATP-binding subunit GldA [Putridiphycobacter sp.]
MSIEVKQVFKFYDEQAALNEVSFSINSGEIVGFLGPNGAGKSTMMKIITCYLKKSKGTVKVCGLDVDSDSLEIRKKVGYLPEHNPLYLDMYIKEYLSFVAGIYKLKNIKSRVAEMIEMVGLQKEQHKKIGALSKGYRQRVGLAQAMIHDPEVLILDEPTTGLDPNQLEEIRQLILNIGKTKTVMLSTHIMQEVEAICDRVIIIKDGQIVADDTTAHLQQSQNNLQTIFVEFDRAFSKAELKKIPGVQSLKQIDDQKWIFSAGSDIRTNIAKFAQQNNLLILTIRIEEQSIEEAFKALTKK